MANPYMGIAVCSCCGQSDGLRKVSAVVAEGTYRYSADSVTYGSVGGTAAGGHTTTTGGGQTNLSRWLTPPPWPVLAGPLQVGWGWIIIIFVCLMEGFEVWGLFLPTYSSAGTDWFSVLGYSAIMATFLGLGLYMAIIGPHRRKPRTKLARLAWRQAMPYWHRLFYCFRCDVVCLPEERLYVPRPQMVSFIYWLGSGRSGG